MKHWDDERIIGFDFETSGVRPEYGLQPWRARQQEAWATSLAYGMRRNGVTKFRGGLNPTADDMRAMLEFSIEHDCYLLGHNVQFDAGWLVAYGLGDLVMKAKFLDSMLIWKHATNAPAYDPKDAKRYRLKDGVRELWPDEGGYEEGVDFHDASPEARAKLHAYNERDVDFTLRLARHWFDVLTDRQRAAMLIEAECIGMMAIAHVDGLCVDMDLVAKVKEDCARRAAELTAKLAEIGVTPDVAGSPPQMAALLYDEWKLPEQVDGRTGRRTTNKNALHELGLIDDRVSLLSELRGALKDQTTTVKQIEDSVAYNGDGRTHPEPRVFATYTGRVQYSGSSKVERPAKNKKLAAAGKVVTQRAPTGFALQQVKKGATFRDLIVAPPGMTIVEFDAAAQEFRFMALASGEEVMRKLCEPGEDPHAYMGAQIGGVDYARMMEDVRSGDASAKSLRNIGKLANLSLGFRTSAKTLRVKARTGWKLPMEIEQAEEIHAAYQDAYPGVTRYWRRQRDACARAGFAQTFAGRLVLMADGWGGDNEWKMHSTTINFPVQGTGADQKYLALATVKPLVVKHAARFAIDLHDGLYFFVPDDAVGPFVAEVGAALDALPYASAWGYTPAVPLPWDCKTGKRWGSLKDYCGGAGHDRGTTPERTPDPSTDDLQLVVGELNGGGQSIVIEDIDAQPAHKQAAEVTNEDYAREIYGDRFDRGWLSAGGRSGDGFAGAFAPYALRRMTADTPNYFSCASMVDGARTRNDENFAAAHVFAVDDVGQKIGADAVRELLGEPQAIVETSAGNEQWHYWLAEPCADADAWRALRDGMKAHPTLGAASDGNGLGAYYRLPVGASDKAGEKKGFATRLTRWAPQSRRLSVADIAGRMGVDLSPAAVKAVRDAVAAGRAAITRAAVTPDAVVGDFNLARMRAVGWPILDPRLSRGGFITVECPWSDEHTDGDRAAGYYVGEGGFHCFHAHCAGRGIREFMEKIGAIETPQTRAAATREIFACSPVEAGAQDVEAMAQAAWDEEEETQETMARYLFIKSQDRFVDLQTDMLLTRPVFNSTALDLAEAGRSGMLSAASVFFNRGGRQVDTMTYLPGGERIITDDINGRPATMFNRWAPGVIRPAADPVSAADVAPWLDHVEYIIEKEEERETFLDWVAFVVRHQGRKVNFAVLLKSEQGVGKDMMISPLCELLGEHNVACIGSSVIEGQFNGFLENRLVIIEELPSFRKTDVYDRLKAWVSTAQKYTTINEKYMKPYAVRNTQAWLMMTNHEDAMALPDDDRRYFVISSDASPREAGYYDALASTLADPAFLSRLYRWLNDRDLSRFDAMGRAPDTEAKRAMVKATRQPLDAWIIDETEDGLLTGRRLVAVSEIIAAIQAGGELPRDVKTDERLPTRIGKALRRAGWELLTRYWETAEKKCKQTIFIRRSACGVRVADLEGLNAPGIIREWTKERNEAAAERMRQMTP